MSYQKPPREWTIGWGQLVEGPGLAFDEKVLVREAIRCCESGYFGEPHECRKSSPSQGRSTEYYLEIIRKWKRLWMSQTKNSESDYENYHRRAFGVDANMQHSLAKMLADDNPAGSSAEDLQHERHLVAMEQHQYLEENFKLKEQLFEKDREIEHLTTELKGYAIGAEIEARMGDEARRELTEEKAKVASLRKFARTVRDDFECDYDAHKNSTFCRSCEAAEVIKETEPQKEGT